MTTTLRRNPIIRAVALLALALGLFAAAPLSAGAAQACSAIPGDYASTMELHANPSTTTPGSTVVITGTGYPKNCTLTVYVDGNSIGTATTNENGEFSKNWLVGEDAKLGDHTVSTNVSGIVLKANVTVQLTNGSGTGGNNNSGASTSLPATGADVLPFLGGGVALLVIGSLLVLGTRKRNSQHA